MELSMMWSDMGKRAIRPNVQGVEFLGFLRALDIAMELGALLWETSGLSCDPIIIM